MLSKRLNTLVELASLYAKGRDVYDIGCDHCQVGEQLLLKESIPNIHCVDKSKKALDRAFDVLSSNSKYSDIPSGLHYNQSCLHRLVINGNKLKILQKSLILIAGMGGLNINDIIAHLHLQCSEHIYILSPHKNIIETKSFLKEIGFKLFEEKVLLENGKFYEIFIASRDGNHDIHPYGNLIWQSKESYPYFKYLSEHHQKYQSNPKSRLITEYLRENSPPKPI